MKEYNPLLLEYLKISNGLFCESDGSKKEFLDNQEWHYIPSNLNQNLYLLKKLEDKGLLKDIVSICDCGIGLGTTMYDFYLQSKELDKDFTFTGIEKYESYINYFNDKLSRYWEGNLNLINGEIMEQDYSKYNIIYSYSPFKTEEKLIQYYKKIINDIKPDSLIIEFRNKGIGYDGTLLKLHLNESEIDLIKIDDIVIFKKSTQKQL